MTFAQIRDRAARVRLLPLPEVLLLTGAQRDRYDQAKWHTPKGSISIHGMNFMNWKEQFGGGGAIDLAMHLKDFDFLTAVVWLGSHFLIFDDRQPAPPLCRPELILPHQEPPNLPGVTRYLVQERAIDAALIQSLIESGRLYADLRGNAVFLLLGKENQPVGAELRGTTPARWRGMAPGSRKDLGYFSVPVPVVLATTVILCESAIDAISCFVLHPGCLCVSTSGARPNPSWLPFLLHQGLEIYCGFDADLTADKIAHQMMLLYPTVKRLRPSHHDWNDILIFQQKMSLPSQPTS